MPVRLTAIGVPPSLSVSEPASVPTDFGTNLTRIRQLLWAPSKRGQPLARWKSPLVVMPEMIAGEVCVLVTVTICHGLAVPRNCGAKTKLVGETGTTV